MASERKIILEQPGLLTVARAAKDRPPRCARIGRDGGRIFVLCSVLGVGAFLTWAAITEVSTVTRAAGVVVPPMKNQVVQHLEGGIVTRILVKEGDRVAAGQTLLHLEDSRWTSTLSQSEIELGTKRLQHARLSAEIAGAEEFSPRRAAREWKVLDAATIEAERALFYQRRSTLEQRAAIYTDQIRRLELQVDELDRRGINMAAERGLVSERVESLRRLAERKAVSRNDLLSALTSLQQLTTKIDDIEFQLPQMEAELSETLRRRDEIILSFKADAAEERSVLELEIAKLVESVASLKDRENRAEVKSPVPGVVNKIHVATVGGIVAPGQEIAEIVPQGDALTVDAKLAPSDRGRVWPGMPAVLKISAYDYSVYGGLEAVVEDVSADVIEDDSGQSYFRVRLSAENAGFDTESPVLPGMTADVDMLSKNKTILSYLTKPLTELQSRAFRE